MKPFFRLIQMSLTLLLLGLSARCAPNPIAPTPTQTGPLPPLGTLTVPPGGPQPQEDAASATPLTTPPPAGPAHLSGTIHLPDGGPRILTLRSEPKSTSAAVGMLPDRAIVEVTGRSPQSDWWRVRADGVEGWVFSQNISLSREALAAPCIALPESDCPTEPVSAEAGQAAADFLAQAADNPAALPLTFAGESDNLNAALRETIVFNDSFGSEIWVDQATLRVVQWTRMGLPGPGEALSIDALRALARSFAGQHALSFDQRQSALAYSETLKDPGAAETAPEEAGPAAFATADTFAFRWEDLDSPSAVIPRPFILVVLHGDGQILNYFNTLDLFAE